MNWKVASVKFSKVPAKKVFFVILTFVLIDVSPKILPNHGDQRNNSIKNSFNKLFDSFLHMAFQTLKWLPISKIVENLWENLTLDL